LGLGRGVLPFFFLAKSRLLLLCVRMASGADGVKNAHDEERRLVPMVKSRRIADLEASLGKVVAVMVYEKWKMKMMLHRIKIASCYPSMLVDVFMS
jgi:hypothetical protein